jgi:hypothetical protein
MEKKFGFAVRIEIMRYHAGFVKADEGAENLVSGDEK